MNLDDLMEVWRSQDTSPLHGVNETLLRLSLRQGEAKLRAERRFGMWVTYIMGAGLVVGSALILGVMIYPYDDDVLTGWDYAVQIIGMVAALFWVGVTHTSHRAQARREERFGVSLRDQLRRHIAQIDYHAQCAVSLKFQLINNLPVTIWAATLFFGVLCINEKPFRDNWISFVGTMLWCIIAIAVAVWWGRRTARRYLLPRKHRLEALLQELDGQ